MSQIEYDIIKNISKLGENDFFTINSSGKIKVQKQEKQPIKKFIRLFSNSKKDLETLKILLKKFDTIASEINEKRLEELFEAILNCQKITWIKNIIFKNVLLRNRFLEIINRCFNINMSLIKVDEEKKPYLLKTAPEKLTSKEMVQFKLLFGRFAPITARNRKIYDEYKNPSENIKIPKALNYFSKQYQEAFSTFFSIESYKPDYSLLLFQDKLMLVPSFYNPTDRERKAVKELAVQSFNQLLDKIEENFYLLYVMDFPAEKRATEFIATINSIYSELKHIKDALKPVLGKPKYFKNIQKRIEKNEKLLKTYESTPGAKIEISEKQIESICKLLSKGKKEGIRKATKILEKLVSEFKSSNTITSLYEINSILNEISLADSDRQKYFYPKFQKTQNEIQTLNDAHYKLNCAIIPEHLQELVLTEKRFHDNGMFSELLKSMPTINEKVLNAIPKLSESIINFEQNIDQVKLSLLNHHYVIKQMLSLLDQYHHATKTKSSKEISKSLSLAESMLLLTKKRLLQLQGILKANQIPQYLLSESELKVVTMITKWKELKKHQKIIEKNAISLLENLISILITTKDIVEKNYVLLDIKSLTSSLESNASLFSSVMSSPDYLINKKVYQFFALQTEAKLKEEQEISLATGRFVKKIEKGKIKFREWEEAVSKKFDLENERLRFTFEDGYFKPHFIASSKKITGSKRTAKLIMAYLQNELKLATAPYSIENESKGQKLLKTLDQIKEALEFDERLKLRLQKQIDQITIDLEDNFINYFNEKIASLKDEDIEFEIEKMCTQGNILLFESTAQKVKKIKIKDAKSKETKDAETNLKSLSEEAQRVILTKWQYHHEGLWVKADFRELQKRFRLGQIDTLTHVLSTEENSDHTVRKIESIPGFMEALEKYIPPRVPRKKEGKKKVSLPQKRSSFLGFKRAAPMSYEEISSQKWVCSDEENGPFGQPLLFSEICADWINVKYKYIKPANADKNFAPQRPRRIPGFKKAVKIFNINCKHTMP